RKGITSIKNKGDMANRFFDEIRDEAGYLWGYNFNIQFGINVFLKATDKYNDLDLEKLICFQSIEFDKRKFDEIFSELFTYRKGEKVRLILEECKFRLQEAISFSNVSVEFRTCSSHTGTLAISKSN